MSNNRGVLISPAEGEVEKDPGATAQRVQNLSGKLYFSPDKTAFYR